MEQDRKMQRNKGRVRNIIRKRSVLFGWTVCYAVLLVLLILSGSILSRTMQHRLVDEYREISMNVQEKACVRLKEYLTNAEQELVSITIDHDVNAFSARLASDKAAYYNIILIQQMLRARALTSELGVEQYIYFKNVEKVLSEQTIFDKEYFLQTLEMETAKEKGSLNMLLDGRYYKKIIPLWDEKKDCRMLLQLSSVLTVGNTGALAIQKLNMDVIREIMGSYTVLRGTSFAVLDESGNIILMAGEEMLCDQIKGMNLLEGQDTKNIAGEPCWLWKSEIRPYNWMFVTVLPKSVIVDQTKWVMRQAVPILSFFLTVGFLFSGVMLYINYRPLKKLKDSMPVENRNELNEYAYIANSLQDVQNSYEQVKHLAEEQSLQLRTQFFQSLFTNSKETDDEWQEHLLNQFGIKLAGPWFRVLAIDETRESADEDGLENEEESRYKVFDAYIRDAVERQNTGGVAVPVYGMQYYAVLFNFQGEQDGGCVEEIIKHLQQEEEILGNICVSGVYRGIHQVSIAWLEVCEKIQETIAFTQNFGETMDTAESRVGLIDFPNSMEELLIRYICAGNGTEADKILQEVFARNNKIIRQLSLWRCLCYDMIAGISKSMAAEGRTIPKEEIMMASRLLGEQRHRDAMQGIVSEMVQKLAEFCAKQKEIRKTRALPVEDIIRCVEEHFKEPDFNVSAAAEYLKVNVSYLSKYFKEQTGIGLLNYISNVRISYAKERMQSEKITISKAAAAAGFENMNTFIRQFKKYEGKTPGTFLNTEAVSKEQMSAVSNGDDKEIQK